MWGFTPSISTCCTLSKLCRRCLNWTESLIDPMSREKSLESGLISAVQTYSHILSTT